MSKNPEELSLKRFNTEEIVGQGAFGNVRIVTEKRSKKQYALKYMDKKEIIKQGAMTHIFRERMLLQELNCTFIVGLKYAFQDDDHLFMVIELAKGGDLRFHLNNPKVMIDDLTLQVYAAEMGLALNYMHTKHIIHRDLKPENLLLDAEGHIYLTDFNLALSVEARRPTGQSGTLTYMAPEMFLDQPYAFSIDWWATGTILYECVYRTRPFGGGSSETIKENIANQPLIFPSKTAQGNDVIPNEKRTNFLEGLLQRDVTKRLGYANNERGFEMQIKSHPFLESVDWNLAEKKMYHPKYKPTRKDNFSPTLQIEEMIIGGTEVEYKPRKSKTSRKSFTSRIFGSFFKPKVESPTAEKTREEKELDQMDLLYVPYDFELPNQPVMQLPGQDPVPLAKKMSIAEVPEQETEERITIAQAIKEMEESAPVVAPNAVTNQVARDSAVV